MSKWSELEKVLKRYTPETQTEVLRRILVEYFNNNFKDFCVKCLGYQDVNEYTHGDVISALESPNRRKLFALPRGTLKSTLVCIAWPHWLLNRNPNERILLDSQLFTNSRNFLREIRHNMKKPGVTDIFGEYESKSESWTSHEITIAHRTKVYKEASITCGGVGTVKVGQHYSVIIGDDYNSDKNSATEDGREKVINHYKMNISILEPDGIFALVGTRYAADDVIGFVLANEIMINLDQQAVL